MEPAESASGTIVWTVAPRERRASASARAAALVNARSGGRPPPAAVGIRHSTRLPRPAGAASRFVGLHTPPSTYSRPAIVTGSKRPGTAQDARTAWATVARGVPGRPNIMRRPLRRATAGLPRPPAGP